jgi:hypothetical protein
MATSGTTAFDLSIDRIVERAYARCGMNIRTGYELSAARDNLNLLFSEWGNRGIHLWKVENTTTNLTAGTATYSMTKISRSEYENLPNKTSQGTPSQYYIRRNLSNVTITLYQTPDTTNTQINYYYVGRIEDVGAYTNTPDAPFRFLPCLVSGLAYYTAQEVAPERSQELERRYEAELQRALTEDSQSTSVHIVPRNFYPGG